jgi:DnaJ-class molecular chaperone
VDLADLFGGGGQVDLGDLLGGAFGGFGRGRRQAARARKGGNVKAEIQIPFQLAVDGGKQDITIRRENSPVDQLSVTIPAGISAGKVIRLAGQGGSGQFGGPNGDVLVTIKVASHPFFRREQNNLLVDLPLTTSEAALGAKIEVPTLSEGNVVLTVPPGTSSGSMLRLRGKGVRNAKTGKRGDQLVVIKIVVPKDLSDRAKQLLSELAKEAPQSPRDGLWT